MPVELELVMDDATKQRLSLPVEVWYGGNSYTASVPGPKKVVRVTIDPKNYYPDIRRENNRWQATSTARLSPQGSPGQ
jgi:hypothetical protein